MSSDSMTLAVAIPTKDRLQDLDLTLSSVFNQTILPRQLIIVDQSVDDASQLRVKERYGALQSEIRNSVDLIYFRDPSITGLTAARNRAIKAITTGIVLFLDDDVLLEHDFNEQILRAYMDRPEAVGISGIVTNYSPPPFAFRYWTYLFVRGPFRDDRQPIYWLADRLRNSLPIRVTRLGGGLMSFRVRAIREVRFDDCLHGTCDGEDVEFCSRLWPNRLFITAKARLTHKKSPAGRTSEHWLAKHARTNWYLYRRNWNYGAPNRIFFLWLNTGYMLAAVLASIRHISMKPAINLLRVIRDSREFHDISGAICRDSAPLS
jgi:GT2 family glycosyltransferase